MENGNFDLFSLLSLDSVNKSEYNVWEFYSGHRYKEFDTNFVRIRDKKFSVKNLDKGTPFPKFQRFSTWIFREQGERGEKL